MFNKRLILNSKSICSNILLLSESITQYVFLLKRLYPSDVLVVLRRELSIPWRHWAFLMGTVDGHWPDPHVSSDGRRWKNVRMESPRHQQPTANHCSPSWTAFQTSLCNPKGRDIKRRHCGGTKGRGPQFSLRRQLLWGQLVLTCFSPHLTSTQLCPAPILFWQHMDQRPELGYGAGAVCPRVMVGGAPWPNSYTPPSSVSPRTHAGQRLPQSSHSCLLRSKAAPSHSSSNSQVLCFSPWFLQRGLWGKVPAVEPAQNIGQKWNWWSWFSVLFYGITCVSPSPRPDSYV